MGEGVDADLMALAHDAAQQFRMQFAVGPDDEEGCGYLGRGQGVEDLWGPDRVRAVVEGQGNLVIEGTVAGDDIGRRKGLVMLRRD